MFKKIGEALFFVLIGWVIWVVVFGSTPQDRMARACTIVSGPGNFLGSMAGALNNDWQQPIATGTVDLTYRCRLTLWNFLYGAKWREEHPGQPVPGQAASSAQWSPLVQPEKAPASSPAVRASGPQKSH
jgi:hypothetical protein